MFPKQKVPSLPPSKVSAPIATQTESTVVVGVLMICAVALLAVFGSSMLAGIVGLSGITKVEKSCSETDNGRDYYRVGTTTVVYTDGTKRSEKDVCNGPTTLKPGTLREWYCGKVGDPAGLLRSDNYVTCSNGCSNGACIGLVSLPFYIPAPPSGGFCGLVAASAIMNYYKKECDYFDDKSDWLDKVGSDGFYYYLGLARPGLDKCSPKDIGQWLCNESAKCPRECQCSSDGSKSLAEVPTCVEIKNRSLPIGSPCSNTPTNKCLVSNGICGFQIACVSNDANCSTSTWQPALQAFFKSHGFKTFNGSTNFDNSTGLISETRFNQMKLYLENNIPVIFHINGHYLLALGYNLETGMIKFVDSRPRNPSINGLVSNDGFIFSYPDGKSGKVYGFLNKTEFVKKNSYWVYDWLGLARPTVAEMNNPNKWLGWDGRFLAVWPDNSIGLPEN